MDDLVGKTLGKDPVESPLEPAAAADPAIPSLEEILGPQEPVPLTGEGTPVPGDEPRDTYQDQDQLEKVTPLDDRDRAEEPPVKPSTAPLQCSRRAWQGIAFVMLLVAMVWGSCGLLLNALPGDSAETSASSESAGFWITRGCCLGPAFALIFLAYLAFMAGRRRDAAVRWREVGVALGVAWGLVPTLLGCAIFVQPGPDDPQASRVASTLFCLLPGLLITAASALFWTLFVRPKSRLKN